MTQCVVGHFDHVEGIARLVRNRGGQLADEASRSARSNSRCAACNSRVFCSTRCSSSWLQASRANRAAASPRTARVLDGDRRPVGQQHRHLEVTVRGRLIHAVIGTGEHAHHAPRLSSGRRWRRAPTLRASPPSPGVIRITARQPWLPIGRRPPKIPSPPAPGAWRGSRAGFARWPRGFRSWR